MQTGRLREESDMTEDYMVICTTCIKLGFCQERDKGKRIKVYMVLHVLKSIRLQRQKRILMVHTMNKESPDKGLDSGKYVRYTPKQVEALERVYTECPKPRSLRRQQLIRECPILSNIEPKQIKVWFQNRRCREKQRKEAARLQTVNRKLNAMNKLLMEESDRLQKQVSHLVYENGHMKQQLHIRGHGHIQESADNLPESKRQKLPALASVIVEAVKVDSLQRLCSSLEPLFRRIVSEEVERALSRLENSKSTSRSPEPKKIQGFDGRNLQIRFRTRMPPHLFTGGKVEGEQGSAIHVVLIDANTGNVIQTGEESMAKLNIVVLDGDFNDEDDKDWTREHFESFEVKERDGKRPILTGDRHVVLKEGVGTLGKLTFTDNSSWIRSRKFRLGVKVASGFHIREAKTEPFAVKDHRGELYKKHYPPALQDEVWRLDKIAKDGALHKKLLKSNIVTVEDFLRILVKDPQKLRSLLGSGMSNRMWDNTVEHAKTCVLGGKLYVYYTEQTHATGVVFNHIYEFRGLIANDHFLSLESLNHDQKISADILVKTAYENWHKAVEYDGKLLNCLPVANKEIKSLPEPKMAQNHQTQQKTLQCQQTANGYSSVPQHLIEYPFAQQPCNELRDYTSMESSSVSGSYNGGLEDIFTEEIRARSSEMLETDDMQRLLKTFGISGGFGHRDESCYGFSDQYEAQVDKGHGREGGRGSGKAVVGWLKLKAALRWGIFIRKKAAERRPQIVEID